MKSTVETQEALTELPVISMWQPWASWVAWGWKSPETRRHCRFQSLVGKRIGIHAAKRWDADAFKLAGQYLGRSEMARTLELVGNAPTGILCTAFVWNHAVCESSDAQGALIECETRRYGLFLEAIHRLETPLECKGRQGIWRVICPESVHGSYVAGVSNPQTTFSLESEAPSDPSGLKRSDATGATDLEEKGTR